MRYLPFLRNGSIMLGAFLLPALFSSCIKDEPLNSEADITECIILPRDSTLLLNRQDTLMKINSSSNGSFIRIYVNDVSKVDTCAPVFNITPGATISPESGSKHVFKNKREVFYTLTSQDGKWSRVYSVAFVDKKYPKIIPNFRFDEAYLNQDPMPSKNNRYYEIAERDSSNTIYTWASGNEGFQYARGSAKPMDYPTTPWEEGRTGSCIRLTTLETGSLGGMIGMPIAAGNLFLGSFDLDLALQMKHLEATRFGTPFARVPLKFSGWYKYKAGAVLRNKNGDILEGKDSFDIYAVFYRNTTENGDPFILNGNNVRDVYNAPIVALTYFPVEDRRETDEWTYFEYDFEFTGIPVDALRLHNNGYSLAVVYSASIDGAHFTGAIGSTLFVDDVKITCK